MLAEYTIGSLAVIQEIADNHEINRALKRLDERLFVEKQLLFDEAECWCVVEDTGERWGAERFVCVYEFRDPKGDPWPYLTFAIVEEMQRRAQSGVGNIVESGKIARRRNEQRRERMALEAEGRYREIAEEFQARRSIGNFAIVPRSQMLMLTRARVREERASKMRAARETHRRLAAA